MKNPFYNHTHHVKQKAQVPKTKPQAMSTVINQNQTQQMTLDCDVEEQDDGSQKIVCDIPEELQNQANNNSPQITINNSPKTNKTISQPNITKKVNSPKNTPKALTTNTIKGISPALAASIANTVKIKHEIHQKEVVTEDNQTEDETEEDQETEEEEIDEEETEEETEEEIEEESEEETEKEESQQENA